MTETAGNQTLYPVTLPLWLTRPRIYIKPELEALELTVAVHMSEWVTFANRRHFFLEFCPLKRFDSFAGSDYSSLFPPLSAGILHYFVLLINVVSWMWRQNALNYVIKFPAWYLKGACSVDNIGNASCVAQQPMAEISPHVVHSILLALTA